MVGGQNRGSTKVEGGKKWVNGRGLQKWKGVYESGRESNFWENDRGLRKC